MIQDAKELDETLETAGFGSVAAVELPILDPGEVAFAVEISVEEIEPKWKAARDLLSETGRWPLASTLFMAEGNDFADRVRNYDLFSRFEYEMAPNADDVSPRTLIEKSDAADTERFLSELEARAAEYFDFHESFDYQIGFTKEACGETPSPSELEPGALKSDIDLDRVILEWELERDCRVDAAEFRQPLYDPDNAFLVFMPTTCSWESLAYIHWFGSSDPGVEYYIALGKSWKKRFGAELWAHYGTMLQCRVSSPPQDVRTGWTLAREHDLAAQCTLALPGIPLRRYAQALIGYESWFLHERP